MTRVVITGVGVVTAIGVGVDAFWRNLLRGVTGVGQIAGIDVGGLDCRMACEVRTPLPGAPAPPGPRAGRSTALMAAAVAEALRQSGLRAEAETVGLAIGTTMGEIAGLEQRLLTGDDTAAVDPAQITGAIAERFGIKGRAWTLTNACAAGNYAIARAFEDLRAGRAAAMVAGGVDVLSWVAFVGVAGILWQYHRVITRSGCTDS